MVGTYIVFVALGGLLLANALLFHFACVLWRTDRRRRREFGDGCCALHDYSREGGN